MNEVKKCLLCRSEVVGGKCSQTRKKDCPYIEYIEEKEEEIEFAE